MLTVYQSLRLNKFLSYLIYRQTRYSNDCAKHPFFLQIPKSHHKFHESSFFPRTTKLWNSLPPEAFPDNYNINKFKSNANKFLLTFT